LLILNNIRIAPADLFGARDIRGQFTYIEENIYESDNLYPIYFAGLLLMRPEKLGGQQQHDPERAGRPQVELVLEYRRNLRCTLHHASAAKHHERHIETEVKHEHDQGSATIPDRNSRKYTFQKA